MSGVVSLSGSLDYETTNSHSITVKALSQDGSSQLSEFQISVINDPRDDKSENDTIKIGKQFTPDDIAVSERQVFNPDNNHIYYYHNNNVDISQANAIADNYLFLEKYPGHILTIDDNEEGQFFLPSGDFNLSVAPYVGSSWLGIHLENGEWIYSSPIQDEDSVTTLVGCMISLAMTVIIYG